MKGVGEGDGDSETLMEGTEIETGDSDGSEVKVGAGDGGDRNVESITVLSGSDASS